MNRPSLPASAAHLVALGTVAVWGLTFVSTKILLEVSAPVEILFARFLIGACALTLLRPRRLRLATRSHELLFASAGLTGVALYFLLENIALTVTAASNVGVIVATSPLFTALITAALGQRSALTVRFIVGFALAMGGVALVSFTSHGASGGSGWGNLLAVGAALTWAVYSTILKRISDLGYEPVASTKRIFAWGLLFCLPLLPLLGAQPSSVLALAQPLYLFNLLFLGLVASAACYVSWGWAVAKLGAAKTSAYIYLVPVVTVTASALILREALSLPMVAGAVLTLAGLVLSEYTPRSSAQIEESRGIDPSSFCTVSTEDSLPNNP